MCAWFWDRDKLFCQTVHRSHRQPLVSSTTAPFFYISVHTSFPLMVVGKLFLDHTVFGWKAGLHCLPTMEHVKCVYGYGCLCFLFLFKICFGDGRFCQFIHTECDDKGKENNAQHIWQQMTWHLVSNWFLASCNKTCQETFNWKPDVLKKNPTKLHVLLVFYYSAKSSSYLNSSPHCQAERTGCILCFDGNYCLSYITP